MSTLVTREDIRDVNTAAWHRLGRNSTIIHLVVWMILFSLPVLFSLSSAPESMIRYLRDWLPLISSGVVFYLNFLVLIDRFLFKSDHWSYLLINVAVMAGIIFLTLEGFEWLPRMVEGSQLRDPGRRPPLEMIIFRLGSSLLLTIGVAIAIKSTRRWRQTERLQKQLEQEHLESELVNLKNQLNPHFFFNTLNNIYSLIAIDQERAQDMVHRLSKMMRYLLYESNEKYVPLQKEVEFINHYLDLMDLRLSDHVKVHRSVEVTQPDASIAPLLFVSLVENAFKHGVSASLASQVTVLLRQLPDRQLTFVVKNTAFPKEKHDLSGSGIGLKNLEKRLQLLYPGRHSFAYGVDHDFFVANLTLQL